MTLDDVRRNVTRAMLAVAGVVVAAALLVAWLWTSRAPLEEVALNQASIVAPMPGDVTLTWLGVSTLLFDDGETQILIDGFFSRPTIADVVLRRPVESDAATINYVLDEYRMRRLAAIIPVHSHFDHAMDVGAIANRSSASILGSASTANIARGAGVPEDQIVIVEDGAEYTFGAFKVTLIAGKHAPVGWRGSIPLEGEVEKPLSTPAPVTAWRDGGSFTVVIEHEQGTTLVHGSAGFTEGRLDEIVSADVVLLGVGLLESLGRDYAERYWQAIVTATGATRVIPVHFDDYTRPFGVVMLMPTALDDFRVTAQWLEEFRATWDSDAHIEMPVFGQPIALYQAESPET